MNIIQIDYTQSKYCFLLIVLIIIRIFDESSAIWAAETVVSRMLFLQKQKIKKSNQISIWMIPVYN